MSFFQVKSENFPINVVVPVRSLQTSSNNLLLLKRRDVKVFSLLRNFQQLTQNSSVQQRMNNSQNSIDMFDHNARENRLAISTPFLKSTYARKLLKKHFLKNIQREIPMDTDSSVEIIEEKFINMKLSPKYTPKSRKPFIFKNQTRNHSDYKFHVPDSIPIETLEKYQEIFESPAAVKKMRLRM